MSGRNAQPCYALVYAAILPGLKEVARMHGYALAVHGSMMTDLDLVAVPWVEEASSDVDLIEAIRAHMSLAHSWSLKAGHDDPYDERAHGRRCWALPASYEQHRQTAHVNGPWIDISVMPRVQRESDA